MKYSQQCSTAKMGVLLNVNVGWQKMGMSNTVYALKF